MNDHLHPLFRDIMNAATTVRPKQAYDGPRSDAGQFTEEETRRGYAMRNGVKTYCCYGMYCDAGHSGDCKHAAAERGAA